MPIVHPLSAANKLRNQVLSVPGTVLISQAGRPDKIIRFETVPDYLTEFKRRGQDYIFINMDRGPDQEAWNTAMRDAFSTARRDRPIPAPVEVSKDSHEEWSVSADDVPVIENGVKVVSKDEKPVINPIINCDKCNVSFNSEHGLKIHKGRAHN